MPCDFVVRRRVEFAETDLAGIAHFSRFFLWMEAAEHAFLRSLGLSVHGRDGAAGYGWPRVHAACDYLAPLRFEEEFEVHLLVRRRTARSVVYDFYFRRVGDADAAGQAVAHGTVTAVYVTQEPVSGRMAANAIPPQVAALIEEAPHRLLEQAAAGFRKRSAKPSQPSS